MSRHPFYYSMVVDSQPLHPYRAHILLFTLEHFGDVPRNRIVVQCTTRVPAAVRHIFIKNGYIVTDIAPYLDETYCNAIPQLDYFVQTSASDTSGIFMLDLDMAVLSPIDVSDRSVVWGKVVNKPLPRLSTLERIFSAAGVPLPDIVPCDWGIGSTFATNFNGGFLYVPCPFLGRMRASWRQQAEFLFGRPDVIDTPAERRNLFIEQLAFALALAAEKIPSRHLTANWNFSCNNAAQQSRTYEPASPLRVLHYHGCLDTSGLVAPNSSDPTISVAAERVNAALGKRNDPTFFDLYKQYQAQQTVAGVPLLHPPPFSEDFIARTRLDGKPLKLVLCVCTPETGRTALRRYLDSQKADLARRGIWYPSFGNEKTEALRPHPLVSALRVAGVETFAGGIEESLHGMPDHIHTVVLTVDGLYTYWRDFTPRAKGWLRYLPEIFDFEMCAWLQEPVAFVTSLYLRYLTNPQMQGPQTNVHGRGIDFNEAMQDDWFLGQLDFLGFYYETQDLFGQERVTPFSYSDDTIETFLAHYAVSDERAVRIAEAVRRENPGLSAAGVRLMQSVNRWRGRLPQPQQERVGSWVRRIDRILRRVSPSFRLNERQAALVNRYAGRGWAILQEECRKSAVSHPAAR